MEQQRILRKRFMDNLISGVKSGEMTNLFRNNEFQIDEKNTLIIPHIEKPIGLNSKMNPSNKEDYASAIALFEAFRDLTPLEAADPRIWNYIALINCYSYLKERWPNVYYRKEGTNEAGYILEHFLMENNSIDLMRVHLPGLWWSVYLSIDETNTEDKYHLTKVMFWNQTLRTRTMGNYTLARKKELALGFLEYCQERGKEDFGNFEKEHQELTEYLNLVGGAKPLSFYSREDVKNLLINKFPITRDNTGEETL
jgi:hypothetical protein